MVYFQTPVYSTFWPTPPVLIVSGGVVSCCHINRKASTPLFSFGGTVFKDCWAQTTCVRLNTCWRTMKTTVFMVGAATNTHRSVLTGAVGYAPTSVNVVYRSKMWYALKSWVGDLDAVCWHHHCGSAAKHHCTGWSSSTTLRSWLWRCCDQLDSESALLQ